MLVRAAAGPLRLGRRRPGAGVALTPRALLYASLLLWCFGCHPPAPPVAPLPGTFHTLLAGETLAEISARTGVPIDDLVELNAIEDPDRVEQGTELFIPELPRRPSSRSGSRAPASSAHRDAQLGLALHELPGAAPTLVWPALAPVSSLFGTRDGRPHEGIDLAVPDGTEVHAAADGVVVYAGDRIRGYGRLVIVEHAADLVTVYAHNSELLVREGERVARGQLLSRSGHTGHVTAPHLHFEVRRGGQPIDPLPLLPPPHEGR